jgi:protoheme IX farnesyltransferase
MALMTRTRRRPLPAHQVEPERAVVFGLALGLLSFVVMAYFVNLVAAFLTLLAIAFYVVVYTWLLKRTTPQNIVIGGAAGALPPVIGWAAVTGSVSIPALLLFALVFYWTPPHFWALSLYRSGEYAAAGVPMLPVVAGPRETKKQMLLYTVVLWPVSLSPWLLGLAGPVYAASVGVLSLAFTGTAIAVWRDRSDRSARHMFAFSLLYLFLIFTMLLADHLGGGGR